MSKIEANGLSGKVLSLSATHTSRQISARIREEDGVCLAYTTVARFLKGIRAVRAELSRGLLQEQMRADVPHDLEILRALRDQLVIWMLDDGLGLAERLPVIDRLQRVIDTRLRYSGLEEGANQVITIQLPPELMDGE